MTSRSAEFLHSGGIPQTGAVPNPPRYQGEATLVDALDHLLDRGAVLVGEATISLAGIELVYVGLNLIVSSVETLREVSTLPRPGGISSGPGAGEDALTPSLSEREISSPSSPQRKGSQQAESPSSPLSIAGGEGQGVRPSGADGEAAPMPLATEEGRPEHGLARLVLTLVELLRQTLERQAIRRMDGGGLAEEEVERMGVALLELEQKMAELREIFGLEEEDLNLDLGSLGRLL